MRSQVTLQGQEPKSIGPKGLDPPLTTSWMIVDDYQWRKQWLSMRHARNLRSVMQAVWRGEESDRQMGGLGAIERHDIHCLTTETLRVFFLSFFPVLGLNPGACKARKLPSTLTLHRSIPLRDFYYLPSIKEVTTAKQSKANMCVRCFCKWGK